MTVAQSIRPAGRMLAKRASLLFTVPTYGLRSMPDFMIIGGQRCGTTSLYRYLARHPAVAPAILNKGLHYFDTNYRRGRIWYRGHFPSDPYKAYMRRRRELPRVITGEGSPYYVFHPLAPSRIAAAVPDVLSILVLRDPVARAYSQYQHEVARGFETLSFEEALEREEERLDGEEERMIADPDYYSFSHQHHSYVARGRYLEQIHRWLRYFPREHLLILEAHELFSDPDAAYRTVLRFLELEESSLDSYGKLNAHSYSSMSERARRLLEDRFAEPDRALREFLGRDLGWIQTRT